jgi:hypothetical protein
MTQRYLLLALFVLAIGTAAHAADKEVTLFDSKGAAIAYIAYDDDATIYLWKGEPVAYLKKKSGDTHIYSFKGVHLGWFEKGIVWDHKGYVVGFEKGAVSKLTKLEPLKGLKKLKRLRSLERLPPMKPTFRSKFSTTSLSAFLR